MSVHRFYGCLSHFTNVSGKQSFSGCLSTNFADVRHTLQMILETKLLWVSLHRFCRWVSHFTNVSWKPSFSGCLSTDFVDVCNPLQILSLKPSFSGCLSIYFADTCHTLQMFLGNQAFQNVSPQILRMSVTLYKCFWKTKLFWMSVHRFCGWLSNFTNVSVKPSFSRCLSTDFADDCQILKMFLWNQAFPGVCPQILWVICHTLTTFFVKPSSPGCLSTDFT